MCVELSFSSCRGRFFFLSFLCVWFMLLIVSQSQHTLRRSYCLKNKLLVAINIIDCNYFSCVLIVHTRFRLQRKSDWLATVACTLASFFFVLSFSDSQSVWSVISLDRCANIPNCAIRKITNWHCDTTVTNVDFIEWINFCSDFLLSLKLL